MNPASSISERLSRWLFASLSVPIYFKVLGIGAVIAALFAGITVVNMRSSLSMVFYQMLEEHTLSMAGSVAADLDRPMSTGDFFSVRLKLRRALEISPQISYIIVRGPSGAVLAHTFEGEVPPDLDQVFGASSWGTTTALDSGHDLIIDTVAPVVAGRGGSVQLGMSDEMVRGRLAALTRSILGGFGLCFALGALLALGLTHVLTKPLHHLVDATERIRAGDFAVRARIFSKDEIGLLAASFNQMADSLARYKREVVQNERSRTMLLEKTIQAQEDERKRVSRELHDELGQSLLGLLLMIRTSGEDGKMDKGMVQEAERKVDLLLEEIRRLAQGMRPPILDDYGLDVALRRLVDEVSRFHSLVIDYQHIAPDGSVRLPSSVELTLYRVAQEALANVVRHAYAERASLVMLRRPKEVVLILEDDGRGFNPDTDHLVRDGHLGLAGLKERVSLLGGTCVVESGPGGGTTVKVCIPLERKC